MDVKQDTHSNATVSHAVKSKNLKSKNRWLLLYLVFGTVLIGFYSMLKLEYFIFFGQYQALLTKLSLSFSIALLILMIDIFIERLIVKKIRRRATQYNLVRLIRLVTVILICIMIISFLFVSWYTAAMSLGLISLILGFSLQTPITSFIGRINILLRNPYRVGDRIQIDNFKGDVVEINYLDTTLWEFGGDYLTNDVHTGRLIRFPNSLVLQAAVFNYSWQKFPYIWNEIPFYVAFGSDMEFVSATMKKVASRILGKETEALIKEFKELIKQTPVDELDVKEYPFVTFRTNSNTWLEISIVYLVDPKLSTATRNELVIEIMKALLKEPELVLFPKGDSR